MATSQRDRRVGIVAVAVSSSVIATGILLAAPTRSATSVQGLTLASLPTTTLGIRRTDACTRIDPVDVTAALGGRSTEHQVWSNGDTIPIGDIDDIGHEIGCTWARGASRVSAWAWVPPVTAAEAEGLVRDNADRPHCAPITAPVFGSVSGAAQCTGEDDVTTRFVGLFGDAWLSCELTSPTTVTAADAVAATDRWCAAVFTAASGA